MSSVVDWWGRRQYQRSRRAVAVPELSPQEVRESGFFSQCGQDMFIVREIFASMARGVFLDIGAHDGVSFSNTCYLERELGWDGVAVEPLPSPFERLRSNRACRVANACIGVESGQAEFLAVEGYAEMLSGVLARYDPRHLGRIEREISEHGGSARAEMVPVLSVADLLERFGFDRVDLVTLDTEGGELEILQTIAFRDLAVRAVCVENNYQDKQLFSFMKSQDFRLCAVIGGDEIYVMGESTKPRRH